jgi:hypothetical protein
MSAVAPSPLPIKALTFLGDDKATVSLAWYRWFQGLQIAQQSSLTPAQVEAMIAADLKPIQAEIDDLQAQIDALGDGSNLLAYVALAELDGYGG